MKSAIRKCFLTDGLVTEARTNEALELGRALLAKDNTPTTGEEVESYLGPIETVDSEQDLQEFNVEIGDTNTDTNTVTAVTNTATADTNTVTADTNTVAADTNTVAADTNTVTADTNTVTAVTNTVTADTNTVTADTNTVTADTNTVTLNIEGGSNNSYINSTITYNVNVAKRVRIPNTMRGGVKKGKYSS